MGSLAGLGQREEVISQVNKLLASSSIIYGSLDSVSVIDADAKQGAFISPLLLLNENPLTNISATKNIFAVIKNGKYYDRSSLDALLETAKKKRIELDAKRTD